MNKINQEKIELPKLSTEIVCICPFGKITMYDFIRKLI